MDSTILADAVASRGSRTWGILVEGLEVLLGQTAGEDQVITICADDEPVPALAYLTVTVRHALVHVANLLAPGWLREAPSTVSGDLASLHARDADETARQIA